jgi:histidinol-phosphate aminotransferase
MLNRREFCRTVGVGAVSTWTAGISTASAGGAIETTRAAGVGPIRIGSNENPYGPAPVVLAAVRSAAAEAHRYPGRSIGHVAATLAQIHGVPPEHVVLACGSGEILRASVTAFTGPSRPLVTAAPTFEGPARQAEAMGSPVRAVPVTDALTLDLTAMAAQARGAGLVFVCNPNNPTGTLVPSAAVTELVERVSRESPDTLVLIDEAYFEYVDAPSYETAVPFIARHANVVVSRTFSKIYGMAGLRVGYAIAAPAVVTALRRQLSQGSLSGVSLAAASAALADPARAGSERARNRDTRRSVQQQFEKAGYRVAPSEANFVMVDVRRDVRAFQAACLQRGVMIARPFPPLTTWARITIGTPDEMNHAVPILLDVLAAPRPTAARAAASVDDVWSC